MRDYDSRRTGNGLLDTGSTPVWSTRKSSQNAGFSGIVRAFFVRCILFVFAHNLLDMPSVSL